MLVGKCRCALDSVGARWNGHKSGITFSLRRAPRALQAAKARQQRAGQAPHNGLAPPRRPPCWVGPPARPHASLLYTRFIYSTVAFGAPPPPGEPKSGHKRGETFSLRRAPRALQAAKARRQRARQAPHSGLAPPRRPPCWVGPPARPHASLLYTRFIYSTVPEVAPGVTQPQSGHKTWINSSTPPRPARPASGQRRAKSAPGRRPIMGLPRRAARLAG